MRHLGMLYCVRSNANVQIIEGGMLSGSHTEIPKGCWLHPKPVQPRRSDARVCIPPCLETLHPRARAELEERVSDQMGCSFASCHAVLPLHEQTVLSLPVCKANKDGNSLQ